MTIRKQELIQVLNSLPDDVDLQEIVKILGGSIEAATTQQRRVPSPNDHLVRHDISTQDICEEVTSPPSRDHRWYEGLSLHVDWEILKGRIVAYKIRWFNGTWSGWYVPGVNDIDGKFNDSNWPGNIAKHNTMRRMWSYFYDHEHAYIMHKPKSSIRVKPTPVETTSHVKPTPVETTSHVKPKPIETTFLKLVLKEMRYLPVTELVGREVTINSIETLASDIRSALSDTLPEIGLLESGSFRGSLAKYGLLDLSWSMPSSALSSGGEVSLDLLEELGLLNYRFKSGDFEEFDELPPDEMPSTLKELVDRVGNIDRFGDVLDNLVYIVRDLLKKKTVLRLFLRDRNYSIERKRRDRFRRKCYRTRLQLLPGYLPRALTVTDACITNAPSLWCEKHFYL